MRDAHISEAAQEINDFKNRRKVDFKVDYSSLLDPSLKRTVSAAAGWSAQPKNNCAT
jgi:hypothetical protein